MKILHVIWRPSIGGAELFALNLARHQSVDHDVCIYYLGTNTKDVPHVSELTILAGGMTSGFDIPGLFRLYRFLKISSFDVIHNHQNLPALTIAGFANRNTLLVRHEHGSNAVGWKSGRERLLSRLINKWISLYIANSESTREKVIKYEHVRQDKIHVVPCGIDLKRFGVDTQPGLLRNIFDIPQNAPIVGFIGRLHPHKGIHDFLKVCKLVRNELVNAHFVIAGDGPLRNEIQKSIFQLRLNNVVHMTGFQEDVTDILPDYTILLVPSRQEAQGIAAIEAMASGVPVIAFATGGLPEVIGDAGVLINSRELESMSNAVVELIEDANLRARIIEKGRQRARQFDMETISERVISLYKLYIGNSEK